MELDFVPSLKKIKGGKKMDNKNVFVAIALSMSVLLFWAAFFETPRKSSDQIENQKKEKNENNNNSKYK